MADITPKFKIYVFISLIVLMLNVCVVIVDAFNGISIDVNFDNTVAIPDNYENMTSNQRANYLKELHGGEPNGYYTLTYPDGFSMSNKYYRDFIDGRLTKNKGLDYSQSSDTEYISKVAGISGTSFLPFASIIINAAFFQGAYPINLIVAIIVGIISVIQTLLILAIILNQLPFFNT